ncbi:MAG: hypothetical protein R2818_13975 [Flavobacteriales bacterium]
MLRVASFVLVFLSTLTGCRKDNGPASWDIDVLAPVVTTRFTISDILPDSLQSIDGQGAITLVFSEELFAVDIDTVLDIPDTVFVYPYAFPLPGNDSFNLPAGFPVISENNLIRFDLPDVALRRLDIRNGVLDLRMKNMMNSLVLGTFRLPSASFPNGSSTLEASVGPGTPANPAVSITQRDLSGASLDLRGPFFNDVNTLASNISAMLDPNGNGATVTNQDSVILEARYQDLIAQYALGYFGRQEIAVGPESNQVDFFGGIRSGMLDLDRVGLQLRVENGVGVDMQVRLRELRSVNTRTGISIDLQSAIMQGPINLNRALDLGNGFQASVTTRSLNNDNSNIDAFIENLPDRLDFSMDVDLNPLGDVSNGNDFLYYNSSLKAMLELEIPLDVIATDLVLENIVAVDMPGADNGRPIRDGELRLFATNGFPFSANVVMDLLDADGNAISSVPVQGTVASAILGGNGIVQASTNSELVAPVTATQVEQLYDGARLRLRVIMNTADQSRHVRLYDRYALDLQITANIHYLVNGNE